MRANVVLCVCVWVCGCVIYLVEKSLNRTYKLTTTANQSSKTHTSAQILRKHEAHEEHGAGAGLADAAASAEAPQERMYCILPQNTANANWEREYRTK